MDQLFCKEKTSIFTSVGRSNGLKELFQAKFVASITTVGRLVQLISFVRGPYKKHLNSDQWFRMRCHLKILLIYSSGCHLVWQCGTILVKGIMRNISVKFF